ncbi:MAG: hypothetical protein JW732_01940 [Dehalococcoidia bacterium]|nr:hypothetical protein [Dehalococcoidia bacterium]
MKKQYLGDIRDLFKYDLIQRILKEMSSLQKFTFIPMLTENENDSERGDGNKRDFDRAKKGGRPGANNGKLMEVLKGYKEMDAKERDFTEIEKHFKSEGIEMLLYEDKRHEYFDHRPGDEYFKNIPENLLHRSLVFVDPDIGLQIKNSTEKHLLYSEVEDLYRRMGKDSILMIYQHFPQARVSHEEYSPEGRSNDLRKFTRCLPIYISDNEIIFFLLTKNDELKNQLERIISKYKRDYQKRIIIGNVD